MDIVSIDRFLYDRVDSDYLDCFSDNLAVLLCHLGIPDVRTPFACQWDFDFDPLQHAGLPVIERVPVEEMIRRQTGCITRRFRFEGGNYIDVCRDMLQKNHPILIFGDAYFLPWLPYFGHEHMQHSFIVDGLSDDTHVLHIIDAYSNRTEWGNAEPVETSLPASALERIVQELDTPDAGSWLIMQQQEQVQKIDLHAMLLDNAQQIGLHVREHHAIRHFSQYYAQDLSNLAAIKQFTLACWLVARSRGLHQLWLRDIAHQFPTLLDTTLPGVFLQEVSKPWERISEFAYILLRRVSQGKRPPLTCFQMLEETISPNEERIATLLTQCLEKAVV